MQGMRKNNAGSRTLGPGSGIEPKWGQQGDDLTLTPTPNLEWNAVSFRSLLDISATKIHENPICFYKMLAFSFPIVPSLDHA
jgi:hypothetical protein